ncbi:hypothetical protein [uncultured Nostoc sp.]
MSLFYFEDENIMVERSHAANTPDVDLFTLLNQYKASSFPPDARQAKFLT